MGDATATTLPWGVPAPHHHPRTWGCVPANGPWSEGLATSHCKTTPAHNFTSCYGIFRIRAFRENLHYFKCLYYLVKEGTWADIKEQSCKHSVKPRSC